MLYSYLVWKVFDSWSFWIHVLVDRLFIFSSLFIASNVQTFFSFCLPVTLLAVTKREFQPSVLLWLQWQTRIKFIRRMLDNVSSLFNKHYFNIKSPSHSDHLFAKSHIVEPSPYIAEQFFFCEISSNRAIKGNKIGW